MPNRARWHAITSLYCAAIVIEVLAGQEPRLGLAFRPVGTNSCDTLKPVCPSLPYFKFRLSDFFPNRSLFAAPLCTRWFGKWDGPMWHWGRLHDRCRGLSVNQKPV